MYNPSSKVGRSGFAFALEHLQDHDGVFPRLALIGRGRRKKPMAHALQPFGTRFDEAVAGCAMIYAEQTVVYMGEIQPSLKRRVA